MVSTATSLSNESTATQERLVNQLTRSHEVWLEHKSHRQEMARELAEYELTPAEWVDRFEQVLEHAIIDCGEQYRPSVVRCDDLGLLDLLRRPATPPVFEIGLTDAFLQAVLSNETIDMTTQAAPSKELCKLGNISCEGDHWLYKQVSARTLFAQYLAAFKRVGGHDFAFVDQIDQDNNLRGIESSSGARAGLPSQKQRADIQACILLTSLVSVKRPVDVGEFDFDKLADLVSTLVRMQDNALDVMHWTCATQKHRAVSQRRIGIGFAGLEETLAILGLGFDSIAGRAFAARVQRIICLEAYRASIDLAKERGAFPLFDAKKFLEGVSLRSEGTFASRLPEKLKGLIRVHGIRNSHLLVTNLYGYSNLSCSPTGDGGLIEGLRLVRQSVHPKTGASLLARDQSVESQVEMLKEIAQYSDSTICGPVRIPESFTGTDLMKLVIEAWAAGLKGLRADRRLDFK